MSNDFVGGMSELCDKIVEAANQIIEERSRQTDEFRKLLDGLNTVIRDLQDRVEHLERGF